MARKKLTRFVISIGDRPRQLFKVDDQRDELRIILVPAELFTDPPHEDTEIVEQRFSVHATKESPHQINQIKQTICLKGGHIIESYLDTKGPKASRIEQIFSRICPHLGISRYDAAIKPKDIIKSLGSYNPRKKTLLYSVQIGTLQSPLKIPGSSRYKQIVHDFSNFRLYLIYTFLDIPSHSRGQLLHNITKPLRYNKETSPTSMSLQSQGMTQSQAKQRAMFEFSRLQEIGISFLPQEFTNEVRAAIQEVGFGLRTDKQMRKKRRRVASRTVAVLPGHQKSH